MLLSNPIRMGAFHMGAMVGYTKRGIRRPYIANLHHYCYTVHYGRSFLDERIVGKFKILE